VRLLHLPCLQTQRYFEKAFRNPNFENPFRDRAAALLVANAGKRLFGEGQSLRVMDRAALLIEYSAQVSDDTKRDVMMAAVSWMTIALYCIDTPQLCAE
jgi:hypothetical protein